MATKDTTFAPPLSQLLTASPVLATGTSQIQPQNIVGYPSDPFKFLAGDGLWKPAASPVMFAPPCADTGAGTVLVANQAYLFPLANINARAVIAKAFVPSAAQSGNLDVGVYYTDDSKTYFRAFSRGTVANVGAVQKISFPTPTAIYPQTGRLWYGALAFDNAVATPRLDVSTIWTDATNGQVLTKATSFPLPATIVSPVAGGAAGCPYILFTT